MKFLYQYRTSDNAVHDGSISATSRDAVFETLKKAGVKPFGIMEAPGFFNKVIGKGKRWIAIVVLTLVALAAILVAFNGRDGVVASCDRHQIYGDPAIMGEILDSAFAAVFEHPGERLLAAFAQPGIDCPVPRVEPAKVAESLGHHFSIGRNEPREVREFKAIVNGMKAELHDYLAAKGDVADYVQLLRERQSEEAALFARVVEELRDETDGGVWESKNAALRAVGLRTVPRPKKEVELPD